MTALPPPSMPVLSRAEAKAHGLKRFFTGKPCKRGHVAERYVSQPNCVECAKLWKADNKETAAEAVRRWTETNRERVRANQIAWSERNREAENLRLKAYAKANPENIRLTKQKWLKNNSSYFQNYAKNNPEVIKAACQRRRGREKGAAGTHTAACIANILKMQKRKCAVCKKKLGKYHIDHIVPLALNGANDRRNLQALCPKCNLYKGAKDPIAYMQELGMLL